MGQRRVIFIQEATDEESDYLDHTLNIYSSFITSLFLLAILTSATLRVVKPDISEAAHNYTLTTIFTVYLILESIFARKSQAINRTAHQRIETLLLQQNRLNEELHTYLFAESLGLNPGSVPQHRFVPIRVYLQDKDEASIEQVSMTLIEYIESLGITLSDDF